jgi:hypothetical protein
MISPYVYDIWIEYNMYKIKCDVKMSRPILQLPHIPSLWIVI